MSKPKTAKSVSGRKNGGQAKTPELDICKLSHRCLLQGNAYCLCLVRASVGLKVPLMRDVYQHLATLCNKNYPHTLAAPEQHLKSMPIVKSD